MSFRYFGALLLFFCPASASSFLPLEAAANPMRSARSQERTHPPQARRGPAHPCSLYKSPAPSSSRIQKTDELLNGHPPIRNNSPPFSLGRQFRASETISHQPGQLAAERRTAYRETRNETANKITLKAVDRIHKVVATRESASSSRRHLVRK
jgi:hypothetical protein